MTNPETKITPDDPRFVLLPDSHEELSNARNTVTANLTPLLAYMRDRYKFITGRERREIDGRRYDVRKVSSKNPAMSFYTESDDASEISEFTISTDSGRSRIERVEHIATLIGSEASVTRRTYTDIDFSGVGVRIIQDVSGEPASLVEGQRFEVDLYFSNIAKLTSVVEGKEATLVIIKPGSEEIFFTILGRSVTTDLKTGVRKVEGQNHEAFYLPPADILLTQMIRMALNFQKVDLTRIPRN